MFRINLHRATVALFPTLNARQICRCELLNIFESRCYVNTPLCHVSHRTYQPKHRIWTVFVTMLFCFTIWLIL